jgi:hypothetical protein
MEKTTVIVVLSLVAMGSAAAVFWNNVDSQAPEPVTRASNDFDNTAAMEQRIQALEIAVSEERRARQLLEEELLAIYADLEMLQAGLVSPPIGRVTDPPMVARVDAERRPTEQRQAPENREIERRNAMLKAGLAPERADYILRRESEMRYEAMQAVFEARKAGESVDRFSPGMNPDTLLRQEIGDSDYELYLEANGRPTSVGVSSVMAASPAERAGLQSGDEIVGYDGDRVFSSFELMQRTMDGGDGNVIVDVIRDGSPMQIVVPRGPIGVEIGRFRGR